MTSETSLVAKEVRLEEWTNQIRDCKNRPADMKVEAWCAAHGISKANYYYRLRRVREACLKMCRPELSFVEVPKPRESEVAQAIKPKRHAAAQLTAGGGISIELNNEATQEFIRNLIGAIRDAQ